MFIGVVGFRHTGRDVFKTTEKPILIEWLTVEMNGHKIRVSGWERAPTRESRRHNSMRAEKSRQKDEHTR
jgi:hypothetical protein